MSGPNFFNYRDRAQRKLLAEGGDDSAMRAALRLQQQPPRRPRSFKELLDGISGVSNDERRVPSEPDESFSERWGIDQYGNRNLCLTNYEKLHFRLYRYAKMDKDIQANFLPSEIPCDLDPGTTTVILEIVDESGLTFHPALLTGVYLGPVGHPCRLEFLLIA